VVLPEGQIFEVFQSASQTTLVVGTASVDSSSSLSVAGRSYNLAAGSNSAYAATGSVIPKTALNIAASGSTPAYSLSYNAAYELPANLADAVGQWKASFGSGTLTLSLNIAGSGAITGSNSSGCSYSGSLAPHSGGIAVFDLQLSESCPGASTMSLSGIATLSSGKTVLSAAFVSSDQTAANIFQATH